jgi:CheY-like chemotaxis protein/tRNA A-37 threonylcarbamoyl transferase component Bud32
MSVEAAQVADLAVRVSVLQPHHVQQAWEELGKRNVPAEHFLNVMERKGYLTPLQSQKLLKNDPDGYFLGGYRILYKIGTGTFGRVYRADDPLTGRVVAVKVLRRNPSKDKHKIDLFLREGKVGMTLHHPNIVEILAVNQDQATKQYYMVMEFVEGGTLRDFLVIRKKLDPLETLKILEDITAGLAYAFGQGLTHRDMKLSNVMLSSTGVAKLVDFGLAEVSEHKSGGEPDVEVARTVDYAGLEKATNVPHGDTRSDLFFVGCMGYQLLTGRPPLEMPKDARARMDPRRFSKIPPFTQEEASAAPSVYRLIETMMSLDANQRFQTPSQLLDAIRKVRRGLDGKAATKSASAPRTLFLVESDPALQDVMRERLKAKGYRVLIAADPMRAIDRFRQQPFDVLAVDAGTTGEDGFLTFERIMSDAERQKVPCVGILMLNQEQSNWTARMHERKGQAVMIQPVKFKQFTHTIDELLGKMEG